MTHLPINSPLGKHAAMLPFPDPAPGDNHDDMVLIEACKNGDPDAFEQLVKRYHRRLLRIAQHLTHNLEDAQEAVQEAFLDAFRRLTQFQEKSALSTWLMRITVSQSLMNLRKLQGEEVISRFEDVGSAGNLEERYQGSEVQHHLRNALQKLPPAERVVFVLRDVEGLTTEETAEVLVLTQSAVKAQLWRARLELRERLSKYFAAQRSRCPTTQSPKAGSLCR